MQTTTIILMFGLLSSMGTVSAQPSLQKATTLPRAGDEYVKTEMKFFPVEDSKSEKNRKEKTKKEKKIWNFVELKEKGKKKIYRFKIKKVDKRQNVAVEEIIPDYTVTHFEDSKGIFVTAENKALHYRQLSGDSLLDLGCETPHSRVRYHDKPVLMKYPMELGVEYRTPFSGRGVKDDRIATIHSGTIAVSADEYGEFILPGGDTLLSVIRIHEKKEENIYYESLTGLFDSDAPVNPDILAKSGDPAEQITTDTYRWYEEGFRYPVFETVQSRRILKDRILPLREAAYVYAPYEQMFLTDDPENEKIQAAKKRMQNTGGEQKKEVVPQSIEYSFYPNPVTDILNLKFTTREGAQTVVALHDLSGRELLRKTYPAEKGYRNETVSMIAYPAGTYILRISCAGQYAAGQYAAGQIAKQ